MKRLHVHMGVESIHASVRFYSTLFVAAPAVLKTDYAKSCCGPAVAAG